MPVSGSYFRILSALGNVAVTGDTFGKLGPIFEGQGLEKTNYNRLTIQDTSGSANAGTVLVSEANFIDQTLYGSITLGNPVTVRLEEPSGYFSNAAALTVNTAVQVFSAASNVNGAILLNADIQMMHGSAFGTQSFIAKATAPTTVYEAEILLASKYQIFVSASIYAAGNTLPKEQKIAAGLGLFFISNLATASDGINQRSCRYKLL